MNLKQSLGIKSFQPLGNTKIILRVSEGLIDLTGKTFQVIKVQRNSRVSTFYVQFETIELNRVIGGTTR